MHYKKWIIWIALLCSMNSISHAAIRVPLSRQNTLMMHSLMPAIGLVVIGNSGVRELNRAIDGTHTMHIRLQQTHIGYPIWNANIIAHIPALKQFKSSLDLAKLIKQPNVYFNGVIYQQVNADLQNTSTRIFQKENAQQVLSTLIKSYQSTHVPANITHTKNDLMVFVDKNNKAHWVYKVSFYVLPVSGQDIPAQPAYLIDAVSGEIYKSWNNIKTETSIQSQPVEGGGFGGNHRLGRLHYDGWSLPAHRGKLSLLRDLRQQCYFKNQHFLVLDARTKKIVSYYCPELDPDHNNVYWNDTLGAANGGFSTSNDVMFAAQMVYEMYEKWFGMPPIKNMSNVIPLMVTVHFPGANAYWDEMGQHAYFGDGSNIMFPLTTIDVVGHEFSHGFTQQHANLEYEGESGGMNEAFSDMAGVTLLYYVTNQLSWHIGAGIFKNQDKPIRWMDTPAKDGYSIEHIRDYQDDLNVHQSSGIYNKFFYLLATTPNWNIKKAFALMVRANQYYWTSTSTFQEGACGVVVAAHDLNYAVPDVQAAFKQVGINTASCL